MAASIFRSGGRRGATPREFMTEGPTKKRQLRCRGATKQRLALAKGAKPEATRGDVDGPRDGPATEIQLHASRRHP